MANPETSRGARPEEGAEAAGARRARQPLFYGWWVMAGLVALRFMGGGVGLSGRGLYVLPLEQALGVGRASISSIFTASQLAIGITGTLAGWLTDRYGPRKIMGICLLISGAGFFALAAANSLWQLVLIFGVPLGLAFNWGVTQPPTAITNNWFERRKATSLSLLNVGTGSGGLLLPLLALAISQLGWRWAAALSGVAFLAVALPVVLLVRNTPEEMGLLPDGAPGGTQRAQDGGLTLPASARRPLPMERLIWIGDFDLLPTGEGGERSEPDEGGARPSG
jgi:MFS family permease